MAISRSLRFQILRRDNHTCQSCGRSAPDVALQVDHVLPEALGGRTEAANLRALCEDCNRGKSATPPDAAQLAQVADDASRWAQAQQEAARRMLTDLDRVQQAHAGFDRAWLSWTSGEDKEEVPRPSDWRESVDRLLAVGLPMPILLNCVEQAMRAPRVPADRTFRYMCGIAWRRADELREATAAVAAGQSSHAPSGPDDAAYLADNILSFFDTGQRDAFRDAAIEEIEGASGDVSESHVSNYAARMAFEQKYGETESWEFRTNALFKALPPAVRDRVLTQAEGDVHSQQGPNGYTAFDVNSWAVHLLAYEIEALPRFNGDWPAVKP